MKKNWEPGELELYRRVAYYYYKENMTQQNIADELHITRQRVNKILSECLALRIVNITIEGMNSELMKLETELRRKFSLKDVRIAIANTEEDILGNVGNLAAKFVADEIQDNDIIGCSRGKFINSLIDSIEPQTKENLKFVPLMGSWNTIQGNGDIDEIIYKVADKFNADRTTMPAPVVVSRAETKKLLYSEPFFEQILSLSNNCTVALVGIGEMDQNSFYGYLAHLLNSETAASPLDNAAGEICTSFYDIDGQDIFSGFEDYIISIDRQSFKSIPKRIGITGGLRKLEPTIGALRGHYLTHLIVDQGLAEALVEY